MTNEPENQDDPDTNPRLERKYKVFKVFNDDKRAIQRLARVLDVDTRHDALLAMIPIIEQLEFRDQTVERESIRVGIPEALDDAIRDKMKTTGQTYIDVFLAAVKHMHANAEEIRRSLNHEQNGNSQE